MTASPRVPRPRPHRDGRCMYLGGRRLQAGLHRARRYAPSLSRTNDGLRSKGLRSATSPSSGFPYREAVEVDPSAVKDPKASERSSDDHELAPLAGVFPASSATTHRTCVLNNDRLQACYGLVTSLNDSSLTRCPHEHYAGSRPPGKTAHCLTKVVHESDSLKGPSCEQWSRGRWLSGLASL